MDLTPTFETPESLTAALHYTSDRCMDIIDGTGQVWSQTVAGHGLYRYTLRGRYPDVVTATPDDLIDVHGPIAEWDPRCLSLAAILLAPPGTCVEIYGDMWTRTARGWESDLAIPFGPMQVVGAAVVTDD